MTLDVHIVSHTHWDREWYHPLERFRQKLVALADELVDDPPLGDESFLLDGQAIIIEDYLEIRPERSEIVAELLRDGRLEAGPWYVLADELIPSGEALVRNLLTGRRVLRRLGATSPPVLYCPDSFGHPAALPSIAAGFGFPVVVLWRGYGGSRWPVTDTARWVAPNGDAVILYHLPRDGYEFGSHLPLEPTAAEERWARMRAELAPRSVTGVLLVPNGADHHARQSNFRSALSALEEVATTDGAHRSSLRDFAASLVDRAETSSIPVVRGELRDSYGYTWTLQGTFATRAHEKRLNAAAERLLIRESEPWSALSAREGTSRRALVQHAWRTLLTAHPHDTLCGCSLDAAADAMELRLHSAMNEAAGVRDDSIEQLIGYDAAAAREARDRWTPTVLVRNPAPRVRSGVAVIDVEQFVADVAVGPGSAPRTPPAAVVPREKPKVEFLGSVQVLSNKLAYSRTESPRHYPDNDLVAVTRIAAWITDAPAYGIVGHALGSGSTKRPSATGRVTAKGSALRNDALAVSVAPNGTITVDDLASGRRIESLLELIDELDVGDLYTPAPRARAFTVHFRRARVVHRGPLRGEVRLGFRIMDGAHPRIALAEGDLHLVLDAGAPFLRIGVRGENLTENHRVRLAIRSDIRAGDVYADAAFGVVRRERIVVSADEAAMEQPPPTAPLHRYVSRFNGQSGITIFSDGLAEYEARDDGATLVTLMRAVGELSRNDLPERPGHAGWPVPAPGAQCLGPFEAELAVMFHGARTTEAIDLIERTSDDVLNPLVGTTLRSALSIPAPVDGVELSGTGLAFSAVKESEDGDWLVLRCVNLLDEVVSGAWQLPFVVSDARLARLDETVIEPLAASGRTVAFQAAPRGIVTILAR